jgi:hypothetical protein
MLKMDHQPEATAQPLSADEMLAIGWGAGVSARAIAEHLGQRIPEVVMRRYNLGLPDRDHRGVLTDTITHPFDWDGVKQRKFELKPKTE